MSTRTWRAGARVAAGPRALEPGREPIGPVFGPNRQMGSLGVLMVMLASLVFGCGPRGPARESAVSGVASSESSGSTPEAPEESAPPLESEEGIDGDSYPTPATALLPEVLAGDPSAGQGPIQVGPGMVPPRLAEGPASIPGLNELLWSGDYVWGACIYRLTISETGEVRAVDFLNPADLGPEVRSMIADTSQRWRFEPATKDGRPVAVFYTMVINHCPHYRRGPQNR